MTVDKSTSWVLAIAGVIFLVGGLWLIYHFLSESFLRKALVTTWSCLAGTFSYEAVKDAVRNLPKTAADEGNRDKD